MRQPFFRHATMAVVLMACVTMLATARLGRAQDGAAEAKAPTLKVGDPAPSLVGGKWLKGEPVKSFETGNIYVVEFWATWCGPCRAVMPHVTEMQKTYAKDKVVFIGQNVWEEDQSAVEPFVKQAGDEKMGYRVVMDDVSDGTRGRMAKTWMEAAGQNGIPASFVVDRSGKIAWIGHPAALEPVLKQVIAGTFDSKKAAAEAEAAEEMNRRLNNAMRGGDTDAALKVLDEVAAKHPEAAGRADYTRFMILLQKKDYDAAYKAAAKAIDSNKDESQVLNEIGWTIVDRRGLEKRDLDVALKAALRANELTHGKDAAILDTVARVYFEKGQIDKAIEIQKDALSKASDELKSELKHTLERYQKAAATRAN